MRLNITVNKGEAKLTPNNEVVLLMRFTNKLQIYLGMTIIKRCQCWQIQDW